MYLLPDQKKDWRESYELYHDSLYNAAKHCAFLPSLMHVGGVQQTSSSLVAGGGFADVYKGTLNTGQVVALKVPRNFGTNEQIWKVRTVSRYLSNACTFKL